MQRATRNMQHATCARLHAIYSEQQPTCNATDTMQQTTGNVQHATDNVEKTTDGVQRTTRQQTPRSMRHAADGRHRAADSKQPATGNGQHATDNVQQTADNMQEDASTCEMMQQATRSNAVIRMRRAADSKQPAACAKHCMRQPVCNMAQTPRTRCNITIRAVPQQAARAHGADNTQNAMQCTR
jgi:hypothetical protein